MLAFNLCLSGDAAELQKMLASAAVAPSAVREEGMYKGWTLLHAAASKGHMAVVDALLAAGADASVTNAKGQTPAEQAAAKGHDAIATKLCPAVPTDLAMVAPAAPLTSSAPSTAESALPAALGAMQLHTPDGDDDALEAEFDRMVDALPENEADQLTDALAPLEGRARADAMRRFLSQHNKPSPRVHVNNPPPAGVAAASTSVHGVEGGGGHGGGKGGKGRGSKGESDGRRGGGVRGELAGPPPTIPSTQPPPLQPVAKVAPPPAEPKPPQPPSSSRFGPPPTASPASNHFGAPPAALAAKPRTLAAAGGAPAAPPPRAVVVMGTLHAMCSEAEAREREMCLELSALEQLPPPTAASTPPPPPAAAEGRLEAKRAFDRPRVDLSKAVKKYQRPAAGAPPPAASSLRPLKVLVSTVEYLLTLWCERTDVPPLVRYIFLADRLRSVQQDMTVQRLVDPALLARIVRFHALMELEFVSLPNAMGAGYSAVHNRSLLCNALISALETDGSDAGGGGAAAPSHRTEAMPHLLHAELLSYFVLLHADEPQTMLPELARAPPAVVACPAVARALRLSGALTREDPTGWRQAVGACSLLEAACALRLLPAVRSASLQQCNAAYNKVEPVPLSGLCARLLVATTTDAETCAAGHGLKQEAGDPPGTVRFRAPSFSAALPAKPPEPPLAPPPIPTVQQWLSRQQQPPPLASAPEAAAVAPLSEEAIQSRKAKRRPPPKSLLSDVDDAAAAAAEKPAPVTATAAVAVATIGLSLRDLTFRMLHTGESPGW